MLKRFAVISDIHGNLPALEAVLSDIALRHVDGIICLGDLIGKGPSGPEVVDLIRDKCMHVIQGNWDYLVTHKLDDPVFEWHRLQLGNERNHYLSHLPTYIEFYMSGKLVRLCHASPNNLFHRVYLDSPHNERIKLFDATITLPCKADIIGYGDIHGAYIDHFEGKTLFNVGSVGNPLDIAQASYAIIEGDYENSIIDVFLISLVRVPYDIKKAIAMAEAMEELPEMQAYIKELNTAKYRGRKD